MKRNERPSSVEGCLRTVIILRTLRGLACFNRATGSCLQVPASRGVAVPSRISSATSLTDDVRQAQTRPKLRLCSLREREKPQSQHRAAGTATSNLPALRPCEQITALLGYTLLFYTTLRYAGGAG